MKSRLRRGKGEREGWRERWREREREGRTEKGEVGVGRKKEEKRREKRK